MGLMGEMAEQVIWNCMKFEYVSQLVDLHGEILSYDFKCQLLKENGIGFMIQILIS